MHAEDEFLELDSQLRADHFNLMDVIMGIIKFYGGS